MRDRETKEFGKFRSLFFPVRKSELKLFLPLVIIFFFVCFNYNVLRAAKDSLVITAPSSGAEIIPFMKVWAILPMALVMTLLFTRLSNRFSTEKVFYIMMSIFLGFFALFTAVLYPLRDVLHPHIFANRLEELLPLGCKGFVAILRNWTYTTFYVMAELWGTTIMTVLFWGFANEILNVKTAKRFYVLILIGGNLSAICAGVVSTYISDFGMKWGTRMDLDPWLCSLGFISTLIIVCGIAVMGIFRWLHVATLFHQSFSDQHAYTRHKPSEFKMSLRENFKYLAQSKYLLFIATIVVTYNICINLTEVTWKDQLLHLCPHPNELNAYLGKVNMWIGVMATIIALASGTFLRRFSWTVNALIPPLILFVAGMGFFGFLLCKETPMGILLAGILGSTPFAVGVFFGSVQQCLTRASKYTIFDATKELAFIPLSKESKLKGKAAIDGVGSRLGKSGGAVIYQALFIFFGTVSFTVPYVGVILLFVIGAWIVAVCALGKKFNELVAHHETAPVPEEPVQVEAEKNPESVLLK
jgi:AAA family ATP:ADP antiporter